MVYYIRSIIMLPTGPTLISMVDYKAPHALRGTPKRRAKLTQRRTMRTRIFKGWLA